MKPLITLLLCLVCVPAFAQVDSPNAHLWASVRISNGGMGSGTIISPEGFGVTCGHLFRGTIGGKFKVAFADGGECEGTLLYHRLGNDQDIALFSIPKEQVRGYCPVAENPPTGEVRAVGYPGGEGPTLVQSAFVGHYPGRDKWQFQQYINNGQSGGGIFQGNYLVGVMVEKNRGGLGEPGDICTAVPLPTIVRALEAQCGPNGCSPGGALGRIFSPRPNVPLGRPPLGNGQIPPPAPRDDGPIDINDLPGPVPDSVPVKPTPGERGPAGPQGPKGDKGDPGKDVDEARIAKIEALLIELAERKPQKGDKGDRGEQGPPGPVDPTIIARIEAIEQQLASRPDQPTLGTRETLYFTARGLKSCERSDALAEKLYDRGYPLRIITLTPQQTNVSGLPMVYSPDKRQIIGESNVLTFLSMQLQ